MSATLHEDQSRFYRCRQQTRHVVSHSLFLGAFAELRNVTTNFVMSVRLSVCLSAWNNSAPIGRIFMKFI
jgi:hypothetical protein